MTIYKNLQFNTRLTKKEKQILELRKNHTFQEIADSFGLSRGRIWQIEIEAKRKLSFEPKNGIDFLHPKIRRVLKAYGMKTIEEAQTKSDEELLAIRLIGKKALRAIRRCSRL